MHVDLPAGFPDRLGIVSFEQLGRKLPSSRLLAQDLKRRLGALLAGRLDHYHVTAVVIGRLRVLEVVPRAHLAARLVECVGQLSRIEL